MDMNKVYELSYEQHISRANGRDEYTWIVAGYVATKAEAMAFVAASGGKDQYQVVMLDDDDMWMVAR
jgi:hypothetical protein